MTNEQTFSVPVPYYLWDRAGRRIDDMGNPSEFWSLAEKVDRAWGSRKTTKGRPPVVQLTKNEIISLAEFAGDMIDFDHDDDPAVKNCAKRFLTKCYRWHHYGEPFVGQSKGKSGSSRDKMPSGFVSHIEWIVKQAINECEAAVRAEFGAAPNQDDMYLRTSYSPKQPRSRGGKKHGRPWMHLALYGFYHPWLKKEATRFQEYKSFRRDPVIGTVGPVDWQMAVKTLVAHEYAHVVQFDNMSKYSGGLGQLDSTAHKARFKTIYRALRRRVINPNVPHIGADYYRWLDERKQKQDQREKWNEMRLGVEERIAASHKG